MTWGDLEPGTLVLNRTYEYARFVISTERLTNDNGSPHVRITILVLDQRSISQIGNVSSFEINRESPLDSQLVAYLPKETAG